MVGDGAVGVHKAPVGGPQQPLAVVVGIVVLLRVGHVPESGHGVGRQVDVLADRPVRTPRLPGRQVALALGAIATVAAVLVDDLARYENFLFLLGALFVPLFGVLAADWYVLARRRYDVAAMYRADGPYRGVRWPAVLVWLLGFLVYNWINPGTVTAWVSLVQGLFADLLHLPFPLSARLPWLGASIPAFAVAFLAMLAVGRRPKGEDR